MMAKNHDNEENDGHMMVIGGHSNDGHQKLMATNHVSDGHVMVIGGHSNDGHQKLMATNHVNDGHNNHWTMKDISHTNK